MSPTAHGARPARWGALACAATLVTSPALAHGPAPAIIGVAAAGAEGPRVLRLSVGMALRAPDGWRFLCSAAWGGPTAPLASSGDGETTWIATSGRVRELSAGVVGGDGGPDGSSVLAMAATGGATFALARTDGGAALWRLGAPAPVWEGQGAWTGLSAEGGRLAMARTADDGLHVLTLSASGGEEGEAVFPGVSPGATPSLRAAGGALYVLLREGAAQDLSRVDGDALVPVVVGSDVVLGPVSAPGGAVVVVGGVLGALAGDAVEPRDASRAWTCLAEGAGGSWACAQRDLFEVGAAGVAGPVASIGELLPPDWSTVPSAAVADCGAEWTDLVVDAALELAQDAEDAVGGAGGAEDAADGGAAPGGPVGDAPPGASGCAASGGQAPPLLWALLAASAVIRRRIPRRSAGPSARAGGSR